MRAPCLISMAAACGTLLASSLPEQSIALLLDRACPEPAVSYLLLDAMSGRLICSRWKDSQDTAPVGSLVKPFTALAYGKTHGFAFPQYTCRGEPDHCWLARGHGRIGLVEAIAHSCNAYFLSLAANVASDALDSVAQAYGLPAPKGGAQSDTFIGLGDRWRISPVSIAHAYTELVARPAEPGVREILRGMSLSARRGTGSGVGPGAYAKTGTALCMHSPRHAGDGYTLAVFPADSPRFVLLVRVNSVPGAGAALVAGRMRALIDAGGK